MRRGDRIIMLPSLDLALVLAVGRCAYQVVVSPDGKSVVIHVALSAKHGGSASLKLVSCASSRRSMCVDT